MNAGIRDISSIVKLRDGITNYDKHVTDPVMAHFFGLILSAPVTVESLIASMSSIIDRDTVLNKLQYFEALGILDIVDPAAGTTRREKKNHLPICAKCPKRDYAGYIFNENELAEEIELTDAMKQEILFLYSYGTNLNSYRILNVPNEADDDTVCSAYYTMLDLFDQKHFVGAKLGSFGQKIAIVRKLIEKTSILCDPEKRKRYDAMVFGKTPPKGTERAERMKAADHFANAVILSKKERCEDTERALQEIGIAIDLDPDNEEFRTTRQKLEKLHRKNKIRRQLALIDQIDFDLFEGQRLKEEVTRALDLGDHTAEIYFSVAEAMQKKGYLMIAKKLTRQSMQLDPTYTQRGNKLLAKIEQILDYYKKFGQDEKQKDYEL